MLGHQQRLGRYEIIREIARSNDIVWEGFDPDMQRRVAIKELNLSGQASVSVASERTERFRREARVIAQLAHRNIVNVYDVGQDRGRVFLVMELVSAPTLGQVLDARGCLPPKEAGNLGAQVLTVVQFLHDNHVIHRDIKPQNLFVLADGTLKLTDFGISKVVNEATFSGQGNILGTPHYMAPEQWAGAEADSRTDVWAVGVVLYEVLTGSRPFSATSNVDLMQSIRHDTPAFNRIQDPTFEKVLRRCLEKDPDQRYQSAAEMQAALEGNAQAPPIIYPAPAPPPKLSTTVPPQIILTPPIGDPSPPPRPPVQARLVAPPTPIATTRRSSWLLWSIASAFLLFFWYRSMPASSQSTGSMPNRFDGSYSGSNPPSRHIAPSEDMGQPTSPSVVDPAQQPENKANSPTGKVSTQPKSKPPATQTAKALDKHNTIDEAGRGTDGEPVGRRSYVQTPHANGHTGSEQLKRPISTPEHDSALHPAAPANKDDGPPPKVGSSDPKQVKPPKGGG